MHKFTADFETNVSVEDCRVWAYALCEIGNNENFIYGNNIEDFIKFCMNKKENYVIYFHNLKFDGEFIISYLLINGYRCIKDKKDRKDKTFCVLISEIGEFYSIEVFFETKNKKHINKVTFYDSLKILNFSVEEIAKDFNLGIEKLKIDYLKIREKNHILSEEEINYIKNDVEIMAKALEIMFSNNLNRITIGSNALYNYKQMNPNFKTFFPEIPIQIDKEIRESYKGGFTYLNPIYKEKEIDKGIVLDVNSLYPYIMYEKKLPYDTPIFFKGKYEEDKLYPLYIQKLSCMFELKENKIPTLQVKNNLSFLPNEYLKSSHDEIITLTLTNIDLELFFEHYNVYDLTFHAGFKFKAMKGLFKKYIDIWSNKKINAKKEKNGALYLISKLMLNSLSGKFGINPKTRSKFPFLDEKGIVRYKLYNAEIRKGVYLPISTFVTSYGRYITITTSQKITDYSLKKYNKDLLVYNDTDSIHCLFENEEELKNIIEIDDFKLGAWKKEKSFLKAKYLRQKCYIEMDYDKKINVTIAGLPKKLNSLINFDNFKIGFSTEEVESKEKKLTYHHVKGGVVLEETEFSIK